MRNKKTWVGWIDSFKKKISFRDYVYMKKALNASMLKSENFISLLESFLNKTKDKNIIIWFKSDIEETYLITFSPQAIELLRDYDKKKIMRFEVNNDKVMIDYSIQESRNILKYFFEKLLEKEERLILN